MAKGSIRDYTALFIHGEMAKLVDAESPNKGKQHS